MENFDTPRRTLNNLPNPKMNTTFTVEFGADTKEPFIWRLTVLEPGYNIIKDTYYCDTLAELEEQIATVIHSEALRYSGGTI